MYSTCSLRRFAELHHRADVVARGDDRRPDEWLGDLRDLCRVGHLGGAADLDHLAADQRHLVADVRGGGEQLEVVLALEPLADDVHVEEAEESAAEAEAERIGGLGLIRERRVVESEAVERVAEVLVVVGVDRESPQKTIGRTSR